MKLKQYQVDAFTDKVFGGNPAAVVPLLSWPDDSLLQAIAEENNLSETAFFVPAEKAFQLRWFTPLREVDLCGHATLATAYIIFEILNYSKQVITFETRSGTLFVEKNDTRLEMNFPVRMPTPCELSEILARGLGQRPIEVLAADDYLAAFDSEATVRAITPNQALLGQLDLRGVIITAPGMEADFVSRFFAPKYGVPEDPVTGSAHCALAPYWANKLGKNILTAKQVSKRGGNITCEVKADRVFLSGCAVMFMESEMSL
ncbi:PhzF family phenazine biosynthesis protein [Acidithiobacillus ferridurans]|uniref:PhzF family phenazine biosynthesis protein n=1 Tax=Acidithiobacillus ferridurans TaxID=1232575 RepID=UPI001C076D21|nr:PhzF family phenazine biosynthesis protein [Acidithiobacillus ferridurans]MBU2732087.1 PhzF family phenazine biosynthesis protein [Acidithiobacillus ferridurans]